MRRPEYEKLVPFLTDTARYFGRDLSPTEVVFVHLRGILVEHLHDLHQAKHLVDLCPHAAHVDAGYEGVILPYPSWTMECFREVSNRLEALLCSEGEWY